MFLYVISDSNAIKIGIANDVESRLSQLQTGNSRVLRVVGCYEFKNAQPVEQAIHQKYDGLREVGEWFSLSSVQIMDVFDICEMLGGKKVNFNEQPTQCDIEEAEYVQEGIVDKFDYAAMFADGWAIATGGRDGKYWNWRRGTRGTEHDETIYGGLISKLPYSLENMRRVYRDGLEPSADGKQNFNVDGAPVIPVTADQTRDKESE